MGSGCSFVFIAESGRLKMVLRVLQGERKPGTHLECSLHLTLSKQAQIPSLLRGRTVALPRCDLGEFLCLSRRRQLLEIVDVGLDDGTGFADGAGDGCLDGVGTVSFDSVTRRVACIAGHV